MTEIELRKSGHEFRLIPLILIILLLFLRFPFLIAVGFKQIPLPIALSNSIMLDGTYILTAMLIWYERKELDRFNITFNTILIFTVIPLISLIVNNIITHQEMVSQYSFIDYSKPILGIILLIALIISKVPLKKSSIKELFIWLLITIAASILITLLVTGFKIDRRILYTNPFELISLILLQINIAAIPEEPLFRGFIWGYLTKFKWNIWLIIVFQAMLFMIGHIYYVGPYPIFVFIRTFIGGLIFGLIVWKSRSIATSMGAHGMVNSLGQIIERFN